MIVYDFTEKLWCLISKEILYGKEEIFWKSVCFSVSVCLSPSLSPSIPKCSLSGVYGIFWMSGDTMIGTDSPVNGWIASMDSKISGIQKRT